MRHDLTEAQYIDYLAKRAQEPDVQKLVNSWGPLTPAQLATVARVFGSTSQPVTSTGKAA